MAKNKIWRKALPLCLAVVGLLASCGDSLDFKYSEFHPNLTIDNSVHLDQTLASAMNALSPGVFTVVKTTFKDGANYFVFRNNQGLSSEKRFTAIDLRLQSYLHVGMNNGLIVGFGNLDNPAVFYSYDLQCPNCFSLSALPLRSYELSLSGTGIATCNTCHRTYNLNTGGNIMTGDHGKPLERYRASTTGPNGVLRVY